MRVQASGSIREGQANAAGQGSKEATKDTQGTGRSVTCFGQNRKAAPSRTSHVNESQEQATPSRDPSQGARHTNDPHTTHLPPRSANPARPDEPPPARLGACRQAEAYGSAEPNPLGRVRGKRRRTFKVHPEA
ncbi:hypothetical protein HN51_031882 [Arachis hypogaea]